jgi:PKHD-type hydroxylase
VDNSWKPLLVRESEIPDHICDFIIESMIDGYIAGATQGSRLDSIRDVGVQYSNLLWLNSMLRGYALYANDSNFGYELATDPEEVQISKYEVGQFYGKHQDFGYKKDTISHTRKLSISVQLSSEKDYEGGELILECGDNIFTCPKSKGTILIFDSRIIHQVKPVTSGVRYSLVKWIHGERALR